MIEAAIVNLGSDFGKSKFDRLMSYTSTEKRSRINKFHKYEDALRTLTGDILIRYLICKRLGIKNQQLIFGANEYGKPYLTNHNEVEYNISHSGDWVACSIDNLPVGIDVEHIKPIDMRIAERFFSEDEVKSLMGRGFGEREAYFYDLWTLKESYIKAVGKGLSIPLDSFTISIVENNITVASISESTDYYFRRYHIGKDYKLAVCSRKNDFPAHINFIDINELYEEVLLL